MGTAKEEKPADWTLRDVAMHCLFEVGADIEEVDNFLERLREFGYAVVPLVPDENMKRSCFENTQVGWTQAQSVWAACIAASQDHEPTA